MRRYVEIWGIMLRNSLIRELSFKVNFILWMVVEVLWFCGQIVFFGLLVGIVLIVALMKLHVVPGLGLIALYLLALCFGVAVHYSIILTLAAISFWIVRAQGLVYGYFNFLHLARYPDVIFPRLFRFIF